MSAERNTQGPVAKTVDLIDTLPPQGELSRGQWTG